MLKCACLCTFELDHPELALGEIKTQLEQELVLQKYSIGIVMCHPEFIPSGIVRHLSDNLPFPIVGATTSSQCVNDHVGNLVLTIFVMTSDDIQFFTGATDPVDEDVEGPVKTAFAKVLPESVPSPKLAIVFPPLILKYPGEVYIRACEQVTPGVPIFGTIAIDDSISFEDSQTIFSGESYKNSMTFVLCCGNINPRFLIGTLPLDNALPFISTVTKSNGPFVHEINDINAYKYFKSIGSTDSGTLAENYRFIPFAIHQRKRTDYDGIPVIRGVATFTEEGVAIFRGDVDEGSTFTILTNDGQDVLESSRQQAERINQMEDVAGVLIFSCIARQMSTMYPDPVAELRLVKDTISPSIPFMMGYAGGEICPTSIKNGIPVNRFHNSSLIILVV